MTFKYNGVDFILQPTSFRWRPRSVLDVSGDGHPVYSAVREFEMRWGLAGQADLDQLQTFFDAIGTSGTGVFDLPKLRDSTYTFQPYSGCIAYEPERGQFFSEYTTEVVLVVGNIRNA